jgi:outer membrane protein assembly factor BamB
VFAGSGIVVVLRSGTLLALGLDRPRELWRAELGTDKVGGLASWSGGVAVSLPGGIVRIFGPNGRPLRDIEARGELAGPLFAEGGRLYFSREDGFLCSADPASGSVHWRVRLGGTLAAPPTRDGGRLFLAAENGVLFALGRGGGDVLWWRPLLSRNAYRPVLWQGRVIGSCRSPALTAYFPKTGVVAGEFTGALNVTSDPAAVGDALIISAYDKESGLGTLLFLQPPAPAPETSGKNKGVQTP